MSSSSTISGVKSTTMANNDKNMVIIFIIRWLRVEHY